MSDSPRRYRIHYLPSPQPIRGWAVDFVGVSLTHGVARPSVHIGLFLKPREAPLDDVQLLFLPPEDAVALRDALDEVLAAHAARQNETN